MGNFDSAFLQYAIELSRENVVGGQGGPFGAVVVQNGVLISAEANAVTRTLDPTAHAEVSAIRAACRALQTFDLSGCVLYSSCEPCPMCLSACYWARLETVYFAATQTDAADAGFDDAFLYRELALPTNERTLSCVGVAELQEEAQGAFRLWTEMVGKTPY